VTSALPARALRVAAVQEESSPGDVPRNVAVTASWVGRAADAGAALVVLPELFLPGYDPDLLRAQVTRTVRHELAHHLGADELGVREMGL